MLDVVKTFFAVIYRLPKDQNIKVREVLSQDGIEALRKSSPGVKLDRVIPLSDPSMDGKYWWGGVRDGKGLLEVIVSTRELIARIKMGTFKSALGPFATSSDAEDVMDSYWEAPGR